LRRLTVFMIFPVLLLFLSAAVAQNEETDYARKIQDQIAEVVKEVSPAFVNFGGGSGVVVSPDGLVVTNNHVAGRSNSWTVSMPGGKTGKRFKAKVLWKDPVGDIALLQLDTQGEKVPYVKMADSDQIQVGEFAIALGTPFMTAGEDSIPTVTFGVISAIHRYNGGYSDSIQTDAPVNPGNSGGPLINLKGELLGINGQIRVRFPYRVNTGIGLAIPTNQIKRFIDANKEVTDGSAVFHGQIAGLGLKKDPAFAEGALVEKVDGGSTADKAGFKPGDVIVRVNEYDIFNFVRFLGVIGTYPEKTELEVVLRRDGEERKLTVSLDRLQVGGAQPVQQGPRPDPKSAFLGVRFSETPSSDGVELDHVVPDGPADKAGLKAGDIITEFDGKDIESANDIRNLLLKKKAGDKVKVKILRDGEEMELEATLEERGNR
jgi:S1-C subfamily serine protease